MVDAVSPTVPIAEGAPTSGKRSRRSSKDVGNNKMGGMVKAHDETVVCESGDTAGNPVSTPTETPLPRQPAKNKVATPTDQVTTATTAVAATSSPSAVTVAPTATAAFFAPRSARATPKPLDADGGAGNGVVAATGATSQPKARPRRTKATTASETGDVSPASGAKAKGMVTVATTPAATTVDANESTNKTTSPPAGSKKPKGMVTKPKGMVTVGVGSGSKRTTTSTPPKGDGGGKGKGKASASSAAAGKSKVSPSAATATGGAAATAAAAADPKAAEASPNGGVDGKGKKKKMAPIFMTKAQKEEAERAEREALRVAKLRETRNGSNEWFTKIQNDRANVAPVSELKLIRQAMGPSRGSDWASMATCAPFPTAALCHVGYPRPVLAAESDLPMAAQEDPTAGVFARRTVCSATLSTPTATDDDGAAATVGITAMPRPFAPGAPEPPLPLPRERRTAVEPKDVKTMPGVSAADAALYERHYYPRGARAGDGDNAAEGAAMQQMLWTERYAPAAAQDLIGNVASVRALRDWLEQWKSFHGNGGNAGNGGGAQDSQSMHGRAKRKGRHSSTRRRHPRDADGISSGSSSEESDSDDDFQDSRRESSSRFEPAAPCTATLLVGPPGSGKVSKTPRA